MRVDACVSSIHAHAHMHIHKEYIKDVSNFIDSYFLCTSPLLPYYLKKKSHSAVI